MCCTFTQMLLRAPRVQFGVLLTALHLSTSYFSRSNFTKIYDVHKYNALLQIKLYTVVISNLFKAMSTFSFKT